MKKNSGMTIMEILISVCIIGLVLILLFSLLVQVKNEDNDNNIQSNFIINQSTFIKEIEEDITNYGVSSVRSCTTGDLNLSETVNSQEYSDYKCIKITYAADYLQDKIGFLIIYNYFTTYDVVNGAYVGRDSSWMIEYQRGYYKTTSVNSWKSTKTVMKEIPGDISLDDEPYVMFSELGGDTTYNAASVVMPVVSGDGEHYDINLSLLFKGQTFTCYSGGVSTNLKCICDGASNLCSSSTKSYTAQ